MIMKINYEKFLEWVENTFDDHVISGDEIMINSVFVHDTKKKLYCNPKKNLYHCWKSEQAGNLPKLVSIVENINYQEACRKLKISLEEDFVDSMQEFFEKKYDKDNTSIKSNILLPPYTFLIKELSTSSTNRIKSENYLKNRNIPIDNFYYCSQGKYKDRIIIPYFNKYGIIEYWNGRDITDKHFAKYMGPSKEEYKVGKEEFVYFYKQPNDKNLMITEGEFDSVILCLSGLDAAAIGGKELHDKQLNIILKYNIIMAFDNDNPGKEALNRVGRRLIRDGVSVDFIRPPCGYKDWNELYSKRGYQAVRDYTQNNKQRYSEFHYTWGSI